MSERTSPEARIFFVDTHFQRMARRPGGVPRELAIKRAQANIDELKLEFVDWLNKKLQEMEAVVRRIEGKSSEASRVDEAYDRCCQLRDTAGTMGFELTTLISGNLCELLEGIKAGAPYHKETMECHIDALRLTSRGPYCNLRADQLPEMTSGLRRVVERANIPTPTSSK
jgi:hypothetical protein